jgi:enoyl-CoA hydratase/carnithine racemase
MTYNTLEFECRDHIGWLTLNRPERLNALSWEMVQELRHFFDSLEDHLEARVVIVRAAGRAFCAGVDIKDAAEASAQATGPASPATFHPGRGHLWFRAFGDIILRMRQAPQPLIAAVRGPASGAGFGITMACDVRIASESARFNAAFVRVGGCGGPMGCSYFLPRLIGLSRACEYLYTGRFMDATTAERIGLVSRVVPEDQLDQAALELAQEMLNVTPYGLRMTKELININIDAPSLLAATQLENRSEMLCAFTEDLQEAVKANFFEKRAPVYHDC